MSTAVTTPTEEPTVPTFLGFPLNRVVAFFGPQIAIIAGYIATWLVEHLEFLHLDAKGTTGAIINVIVFALTALLTWLGQHKWLDGWQKWEQRVVPSLADNEDIPTDDELRASGGFDGDPSHPDDVPTQGLPADDDKSAATAANDIYGVEPEGDISKFGEGRA
jgi:hypothetical protein